MQGRRRAPKKPAKEADAANAPSGDAAVDSGAHSVAPVGATANALTAAAGGEAAAEGKSAQSSDADLDQQQPEDNIKQGRPSEKRTEPGGKNAEQEHPPEEPPVDPSERVVKLIATNQAASFAEYFQ